MNAVGRTGVRSMIDALVEANAKVPNRDDFHDEDAWGAAVARAYHAAVLYDHFRGEPWLPVPVDFLRELNALQHDGDDMPISPEDTVRVMVAWRKLRDEMGWPFDEVLGYQGVHQGVGKPPCSECGGIGGLGDDVCNACGGEGRVTNA